MAMLNNQMVDIFPFSDIPIMCQVQKPTIPNVDMPWWSQLLYWKKNITKIWCVSSDSSTSLHSTSVWISSNLSMTHSWRIMVLEQVETTLEANLPAAAMAIIYVYIYGMIMINDYH